VPAPMAIVRVILHGKAAGDSRVRKAVYALRHDGSRVDVRVTWESGDAAKFSIIFSAAVRLT
jgi:diacylglycerol kinase family enzyme